MESGIYNLTASRVYKAVFSGGIHDRESREHIREQQEVKQRMSFRVEQQPGKNQPAANIDCGRSRAPGLRRQRVQA